MATYGYTFTSGDTVTPTKLNNARTISAIQTADISDAQITADKLASNAVETAKILDANVTTSKINNAAVTAAKLSGAQTGSAPIFGVRAWCYFNGVLTGTNAPTAGGNVTSVTRTNTGAYTINFTTAMPSSNYAVVANALTTESGAAGGNQFVTGVPSTTTTATVYVVDAAVDFQDAQKISVFVIA